MSLRLLLWKIDFFIAWGKWPTAYWIEMKKKAMSEERQ